MYYSSELGTASSNAIGYDMDLPRLCGFHQQFESPYACRSKQEVVTGDIVRCDVTVLIRDVLFRE